MKKIQFLSASKLKGFNACPRRHKLEKFIEKPATTFGDLIARSTADFYEGRSFLEVYTKLSQECKKELPADHADRAQKIARILADERRDLQINRDAIITIENREDFDVEFNFDGVKKRFFQVEIQNGWGLRGAIDLADILEDTGALRITDHKTGTSQELDDLQLLCYAIVGRVKYGFDNIRTGFWYLEQGRYEYRDWRPEEIDGGLNYLDGLVKRYLAEKDWAPTVNKWCQYCTVKADCPAFTEAAAMDIKEADKPAWVLEPTLENAAQIIQAYESLEPRFKIIEGILEGLKEARKQVLLQHGAQTVDGHTYTAKEYTHSYAYNLEKIFPLAAEILGYMPFSTIKFSAGDFDKLITDQADPFLRRALQDIKDENKTPGAKAVRITRKLSGDPKKTTKAKPKKKAETPVEDAVIVAPPQTQEEKEERAAIMEHDGGLTQAEAEKAAGLTSEMTVGQAPEPDELVSLCWGCGKIHPPEMTFCPCGCDSVTQQSGADAIAQQADILESLRESGVAA